jgi:hypothetical protein
MRLGVCRQSPTPVSTVGNNSPWHLGNEMANHVSVVADKRRCANLTDEACGLFLRPLLVPLFD